MTTIFNYLTIAEAYECLHNLNDKLPELLSDDDFLNLIKADPILKDCVIHINKISYISSKNIGFQEFKSLNYCTFMNIYDRITWTLPLWEIEYVHDLPEFKFNGL